MFQIALTHGNNHTPYPAAQVFLRLQITGSNQRYKAALHLIVREVEQECTEITVVALDGQVSALVNHRQGLFHIRLIIDKLLVLVIFAGHSVQVLLRMVQQADQIGGCAAGEPIVTECLFGKRVQQAERVVYVRQVAAEVIANGLYMSVRLPLK